MNEIASPLSPYPTQWISTTDIRFNRWSEVRVSGQADSLTYRQIKAQHSEFSFKKRWTNKEDNVSLNKHVLYTILRYFKHALKTNRQRQDSMHYARTLNTYSNFRIKSNDSESPSGRERERVILTCGCKNQYFKDSKYSIFSYVDTINAMQKLT